jgi:hypothetical protein
MQVEIANEGYFSQSYTAHIIAIAIAMLQVPVVHAFIHIGATIIIVTVYLSNLNTKSSIHGDLATWETAITYWSTHSVHYRSGYTHADQQT